MMTRFDCLSAALLLSACVFPLTVAAGLLTIHGNLGDIGATAPVYGTVELAEGETLELAAEPLVYTNAIRYACSGYVTEVLQADDTWSVEGTNLVLNATYAQDDQTRRITWLWREDGYALTAGLEYGGKETVTRTPEPDADGYYPAGTEVTLDVIAATDPASSFRFWYGDVPPGEQRTLPLTLSMDAPKPSMPSFCATGSLPTVPPRR